MGQKKVAILQSNYIPWKGYFDLMNSVDEFIIYDSVQYTKNDWRNRNQIKTPNGLQWITIPVSFKSRDQLISETPVSQQGWEGKHLKTIRQNYSKAKHFQDYIGAFEAAYIASEGKMLSEVNRIFIDTVCEILGIRTKVTNSSDYELKGDKSERLVNLCKQAGATGYLSGPAAKDYLDESLFVAEGIEVEWMDYSGYKQYEQLFPPFEHAVSVIDLIFNEGPEAMKYLKSF